MDQNMELDVTLSECTECVLPSVEVGRLETIQSLCVCCPFCQQTVNAIVTEETIACPACKTVVKR